MTVGAATPLLRLREDCKLQEVEGSGRLRRRLVPQLATDSACSGCLAGPSMPWDEQSAGYRLLVVAAPVAAASAVRLAPGPALPRGSLGINKAPATGCSLPQRPLQLLQCDWLRVRPCREEASGSTKRQLQAARCRSARCSCFSATGSGFGPAVRGSLVQPFCERILP